MAVQLKEVTTLRELKKFAFFPYSLYRNNRFWVPPLRTEELNYLQKEKNPAFDFCDVKYWLALKDGKIVGRIAGIINKRFNERWNAKIARFGWFDFIDDSEVSSALLAAVEAWARASGMNHMHGPLGFTDMDGEGALVEGFEETSTLGSLYNYPYYTEHITTAGYLKDTDWIEFEVTMHPEVPEKIKRIAEIALERNKLKVLQVKKAKEIIPYAKEIFAVLNAAYKDLYGFVELSEKQVDMYIKQYFGFVRPEFVPIVLDAQGRVAAFGIAMPSLSRAMLKNNGRLFPFGAIRILKAIKNNRKADLYLTAVRPDLQNKGVNAILIYEMHKAFIKHNIQKVETNRELEDNSKIQAQWRFYDARQHKRRRCYKKDI
jgi:GNAT superfamily N-acetyltransferase